MTKFEVGKEYTGTDKSTIFIRTIKVIKRTAKTITYNQIVGETVCGNEVKIDIACEKKARVWVNADGIETIDIGIIRIHA